MTTSPASPSRPRQQQGKPAWSKRATRRIVVFSLDSPALAKGLIFGLTLALALLATLPSLWPETFPVLNPLRVDTDPENMLSPEEPARQRHNRLKSEFGISDLVVVGMVNETHPDGVFNVASLNRIYALTAFAKDLQWPDPQTDGAWVGVRSVDLLAPSTVDSIEHQGLGTVRFEWLMPAPITTEAEAEEVRRRMEHIPLMTGTLVSEDGKALTLYLPLTSKTLSYRVYEALREKIATFDAGADEFHIAGLPVAEDAFGVEMFIQMAISAPAAMLVIFLLMLAFFRKLVLIVAPMVLALVTVIATMALLVVSGQTVHIMSSMIPIFIMPIAVLDSVHILSEFFDSYDPEQERGSLIVAVMDKLAMPMFYTSLTTAAGFLSLGLVPIPPVQVFGVFVAFGVMLAWLLSMSLIPAYIQTLKEARLRGFGQAEQGGVGRLGRVLGRVGDWTQRRDRLVLAAAVACAMLGLYGMTQIQVNDNPVRWFGQGHPIRVADRVLNQHFGGTYMAYLTFQSSEQETGVDAFREQLLVHLDAARQQWPSGAQQTAMLASFRQAIRTTEAATATDLLAELTATVARRWDRAEGEALAFWDAAALFLDQERQSRQIFKRPEVLEYLLALQDHLLDTGIVGKTVSLADFVRTVYRALMAGREDAYRIPDTAEGVAQALVSYQSSHRPHDLWRFVTPDFQKTNLWVLLRSGDNSDMTAVARAVDAFIADHPPPLALEHQWFGLTYINVIWQEKMVFGMLQALLSGFLFVLIMMTLLLRSALWGLLAMLPLTLTIGFIYGIVGLIGKDYDMPVAVLSSLALGLAVDFSIHFLVRTRSLYRRSEPWANLVPRMFGEPARAIVRNILVVAIGFLPLLAAPLVPYNTVGILIASILIASGAATLLLLPVLLKRFEPLLFPQRDPRRVTVLSFSSKVFLAFAISILVALNLYQSFGIGLTPLIWLPVSVLIVASALYGVRAYRSRQSQEGRS